MKNRMFGNPWVHITIMFVLVFAGTLYIIRQRQQQERQEISRRVEYLKGGPIYANTDGPPTVTASQSAGTPGVQPPPPPPPVAPPPPAAAVAALPTTVAPTASTNRDLSHNEAHGDMASRSAAKAPRAKVTYTLVQQNLLQQMPVEVFEGFGDFKIGMLRNPAQYIAKSDELESTEIKFDNENAETQWLAGERSGDSILGLQNRLALHGSEDGVVRGEVEILRMLPDEGGSSISPQAYGPVQFAVPTGTALVISLNLPRSQLPARSLASSASKFFRMFRTTDFMQKHSQFVMYIVFE